MAEVIRIVVAALVLASATVVWAHGNGPKRGVDTYLPTYLTTPVPSKTAEFRAASGEPTEADAALEEATRLAIQKERGPFDKGRTAGH